MSEVVSLHGAFVHTVCPRLLAMEENPFDCKI